MDLDLIRVSLGDTGKWQIKSFFLIALVKIPSALQMASILYIAPKPKDFWCARPPEFKHLNAEVWKNMLYGTEGKKLDSCYSISFMNSSTNFLNVCTQYEVISEGNVNTIVTQWGLVCEKEILISVSQFFYLFGIFCGGLLCSVLLIRYSPRMILLVSAFIQTVAGVSVAVTPFFELQVLLRFIVAVGCCCMFTTGFIICTDITNGKWRVITGSCYEFFWSFGVIILAVLGFYLPDWRHFQLAISLPTIVLFTWCRFIPNSPSWLLQHGCKKELQNLLREGALCNAKKVNPWQTRIMELENKNSNMTKFHVNVRELYFGHDTRWKNLALHFAWAATVVTYYGALLNVKNIGNQLVLNTIAAGVAEILGIIVGLVLLLYAIRFKWLWLGIIQLFGGILCVLTLFLPEIARSNAIMLIFAMLGRVSIATSLTVLQQDSSSILPKEFQMTGILSFVTFARLCLLTAPFIGNLAIFGEAVSLSAFGILTIISGFFAIIINGLLWKKDFLKKTTKPSISTLSDNCYQLEQHNSI